MGNEASLEGGGQPGEPGSAVPTAAAPGSISAPAGSGQLIKPSNGAPAGSGPAAGPGPGINSSAGRPGQMEHAPGPKPGASPDESRTGAPYRLATHESPAPQRGSGQGQHAARLTLPVDGGGAGRAGTGRSPAVSPGSAPSSPYSVPQIAPMPSSKLCPVCNTTELTAQDLPNSNTCTQCHNTVCNQCGFNPNPHLTQVQEWLCLNCQMQRALGMDMTTPTPRSKSQQQIHSPSHQAKPEPQGPPQGQALPPAQAQPPAQATPPTQATPPVKASPHASPGPQRQAGPPGGATQARPDQRLPQPAGGALPGLAKAPSQPDLSRPSPGRQDHTRSAGSSPSKQPPPPQDQPFGKLFGFGASLLNQASTLISVDPTQGTAPPTSPAKPAPSAASKPPAPRADQGSTTPHQQAPPQNQQTPPPHKQATPSQQQARPEPAPKAICCPLCKTALNVGSTEPPNYNSCTQCHSQVCNLCGFNPTPHLVEKKEWLCLNCQTQRLMSGGLADAPPPQPSPKHPPMGSPQHQPPANQQQPLLQKGPNQQPVPRSSGQLQQQRPVSGQVSGPSSLAKQPGPPVQAVPPVSREAQGPQQAPPKAMSKKAVTTPRQQGTTHKLPETTPKLQETTPKPQETTHKLQETIPKLQEKDLETKPTPPIKGDTDQITPSKDIKKEDGSQKSRHYDEGGKPGPQDITRSPQSLSDTGYSSDGISSSHSEITGLIQEEGVKLSERGLSERSPPSPSEITKLESSMRPLLESKTMAEQERDRGKHQLGSEDTDDRKQRPRSLTIGQEEEAAEEESRRISSAESSDDLSCRLRHDYVEDSSESGLSPLPSRQRKGQRDTTDEEFMRRQIMEMSADEDEIEEEDEGYGYTKPRKSHKHSADSGKEKRRLTQHSNSYEEDSKASADNGQDGLMAGGLRRFKTIELNNSNSYNRDIELSAENDLALDREPELEMESLTGSPDERSRGEYSSTLPATTPSYTSGTSPTSVSSMEEDSDSSPSRRQRLEEAKQQRKARHRSHGPLLPTIEDSSEEDELREEEELLREQEKMREVEQQRIRSTARKTKRDKEELRAQRRRERSKTPPSNLSPIEDASPTEELRQAAEMEELHRSSCSEYSPSVDSEAEGFEMMASKLYKSGSEYNLPTFMSLYSPTEKPTATSPSSIDKPLKSAEEVYEEMMKKAEMLQKQQGQARQGSTKSGEVRGLQHQQAAQKKQQASIQDPRRQLGSEVEAAYPDKQLLDTGFAKLLEQNNALLTPGTSPTQLSAPVSFSGQESAGRGVPDVRVTQHYTKEGRKDRVGGQTHKAGAVSQASVSQTANTNQSSTYDRQIGAIPAGSNISSRISEVTHAYSQREQPGRRTPAQPTHSTQATSPDPSGTSLTSRVFSYFKSSSPPLSPSTSPTQSPTHSPSRIGATEPSTQRAPPAGSGAASPVLGHGTQMPHRTVSPRLSRQQSSQDAPFMVITLGSEPTSPSKPVTVNSATSPITSPTKLSHQPEFQTHVPATSPPSSPQHQLPHQSTQHGLHKAQPTERVHTSTSTTSSYSRGSMSMENISLCRISTVPGTSRVVEQGQMLPSSNVVDLRTPMKPAPIIMTEQGMDLTSLASETRRYSLGTEASPSRHTAVQPLIMNLNAQEQLHTASSTATTVSVTVAASMFISQPKQPVVYGDPMQNRVDLGQGVGSAVCLTQTRPLASSDPFIPKIDACLEDLGIQQQQLQKQQKKLQQQQQQLEEQLQQHQQQTSFARYNLANQVQPLLMKKDLLVSQTSGAQAVNVSAIPRTSPLPAQAGTSTALPHEIYGGAPLELKNKPTAMNLSTGKPHVMVVQLDASNQKGSTVTQLVKPEQPPPQEVLDLTGQIKAENQVACCDVVYKLPFASSCTGPFAQKATVLEKNQITEQSQTTHLPSGSQFTGSRTNEPSLDNFGYQEHGAGTQGGTEECRAFSSPALGRLQPSMSDTNLADAGLQSESGDLAMDLSTIKQACEGGYLGMGMQYGSYTDLRHQGDIMAQPMPLRRYGSMSNINTDLGYSRDLSSFQESNLAQYSATTAREISRMCAALNSMDQFGGRYSNPPELLQYSSGRGTSPASRLNLQHSLASMRANLMMGPDVRQPAHVQAYANLINARQASLRALYPSAVRAADGMIYSTINTPIASTLPITTQPASVLRPMLRGVYRPYPTGGMTAVPLASLTRLPLVTPRMPLSPQGPLRYPPPNRFSAAHISAPTSAPATTTALDTPVYLGKPSAAPTVPISVHSTTTILTGSTGHLGVNAVPTAGIHTTAMPVPPSVAAPANQQHLPMQAVPMQQPHTQTPIQPHTTPQIQPQMAPPQLQTQVHPQIQPQMQPQTQIQMQSQSQPQMQPQTQAEMQLQTQSQTLQQAQIPAQPQTQSQAQSAPEALATSAASTTTTGSSIKTEKEMEEERFRQQQEQLLQLERERVELEKLRQLRLQEELERDRLELQRHREKEQMLVQREIQELQTIKQHVLQQQQVERETQLVMQREQLAQQKAQLDQIQSLQQQLQQQLEEQKRQKTAAAEAAAAAAVAEAAAASAAAAASTSAQGAVQGAMQGITVVGGAAPQGFSIICDQSGRVIQQDIPPELQRTMSQNGQFWQPYMEGHVVQGVVTSRTLPNSASEMSLRSSEDSLETRAMKKRNSMPRLRDGARPEGEDGLPTVKRIADSSVQTDDEDGEERFLLSRRRRTRRIADCSVQTDDEDQAEWEQPVRRRRSRFSKHSESSADTKAEAPKVSSSSIAIQTTTDSSCQTEPDQLGRVSPAIHITTSEPKVEVLHYISAPERTQKGESLACQTEPEPQSQGVVAPQLSVPTTISPYSTSMQLVGSGVVDPLSPRQQGVAKFERRKPDPLEIGYQTQMHSDSLSNLARQPPKSPQVLYSPVSPLSPHRMLETSFSSSERLNKAHVTPQKHFTAESPQRHQTLPRPIKSVQRSMSDPKPLSPTSDDSPRARFSLYQQQALQNSQLMALQQQQQNALMRKVKRTLPSPPPEETPLPIVTPALPHMYASPSSLAQRGLPRPSIAITKAGLLNELKAVEQESTKLRKQQAELEEEEKEIDAKLRYLELGITQRKEREKRELAYLRSVGDGRDYASDSELNNVRMASTSAFDGNGLLGKQSGGAPLSQFASDQLASNQYTLASSFLTYQYPQSQSVPPPPQPSPAYQQIGFQPPQYPTISQSQPQPGTCQPHPSPPTLHPQGTYPSQGYPQSQLSYQTELGHPSLPGFQPPTGTPPYPSQTSYQSSQSLAFQPQAEVLSIHQKPRQTSLADLEQKIPTNYEVISNPTVVVTTSAQDSAFTSPYTSTTMANMYGQYRPPEQTMSDRIRSADSPTSAYTSEGLYSNLEQNIPRNYVMIDDISELTKESMGPGPDMHSRTDIHGQPPNGRYGSENGPTRAMPYGDEPEYPYGSGKTTSAYHQQGADPHGRSGGSSYYYDDYSKHSSSRGGAGVQKHSSKSLAPAVVSSSKRSKHRKQGMEQKISKFSPIEEARDVESDLASYTITTPSGGSCTVVSRAKKLGDEITHGLKKNVYDQQRYYGSSSREALEEEDRMYGSGRSRSTGYGMDKISSRDSGYRSKSYERDTVERAQRGSHVRGRSSIRPQHSEEESPLSPVGKPMGVGRGPAAVDPHDSRNQYGSSHSLPDVDHHTKDVPRSHVYKPDDPYLVDDMHCAVSDSEAYHLGQEETDWFEKPREARSDRSRHGGSGGGHSSSGRRSHVKHTYHDYDEPPEEDLWPQEDYGTPRHSSSREHRHHGSSGSSGGATPHPATPLRTLAPPAPPGAMPRTRQAALNPGAPHPPRIRGGHPRRVITAAQITPETPLGTRTGRRNSSHPPAAGRMHPGSRSSNSCSSAPLEAQLLGGNLARSSRSNSSHRGNNRGNNLSNNWGNRRGSS
ncbi:hypothetical protein ANANG_G00249080 [Anguilla anguilla]|uniref:Zinc finger piccolo-type domain-containing protein n=1 Tax=Anguilla anguilla TaxID=7936 RepID=A0A9D3RMP2_ANGAN|nr:hypothetical protein ANANG_G00249080 [Anguilla anguilla]